MARSWVTWITRSRITSARIACAPVAGMRIPRRPWRRRQLAQPVGIDPGFERRRPGAARIPPGTVGRGAGAERTLPFAVGSYRLAGTPGFDVVTSLDAAADPTQRRPLVDVGALPIGWVGRAINGRFGGVLRHALARLWIVTVGRRLKNPITGPGTIGQNRNQNHRTKMLSHGGKT